MVQGRWFPMGSDISVAISMRQEVFGRGGDALDEQSQQVVVYEAENRPVGAARLWWADGAFRLGDVGVAPDKRGRGFGDLLVRLLLYKALTHSAAVIRLSTPAATESFFAQYGFERVSEADGQIEMQIRGEDVHLSHCGGDCSTCGHRSAECVPKALREE